jgi:dUTP pyrophosphatase
VLLVNLGEKFFDITRGMRVAQLVVAPVTRVAPREAQALSRTSRGAGGYGSTGE